VSPVNDKVNIKSNCNMNEYLRGTEHENEEMYGEEEDEEGSIRDY
jgi:hypothetical protein